ncbi:MAG: hypothetical protein P4L03_00945 [Terracidiphilus sp.]|nr:hypothetical protein [Terracidiphilus sp.]
MRMWTAVLVAGCAMAAVTAAGQQKSAEEQREFHSWENTVAHPAAIPAEALAALAKDEAVRAELTKTKLAAEKLPADWFLASEIHLTDGGTLLVVEAGPRMHNEYEAQFWVFDRTEHGYAMVLDEVGRVLTVGKGEGHPGIRVEKEHYHIYPSTSYRWKDGHYATVIVK